MIKQNKSGKQPAPNRLNKILTRSGQVTLEAVLLMTLTVGIFAKVTSEIKSKHIFDNIIGAPWLSATGMIECGVWGTRDKVCKAHPNQIDRAITRDK